MHATAGDALIRQISTYLPPAHGLTFWWLGQHSVVLKLGGRVLYFDPYLAPSPARRTPPLLLGEQVTNADLVLCSHDHSDHIDPEAITPIAATTAPVVFVAPRPARERMLSLGVPAQRLLCLDDGDSEDVAGVKITGIKAAHEFFDYQEGIGHPHMGYVAEADGCAVYHSGDTLCYEGLLSALARWNLTVAFLPINGRDARRYRSGCIGNMTYQEAVDLAGALRPRLVVPTHYDMFAGNSEDPELFVDYLDAKFPGQACWVGEPGVPVDVA